MVVLLNPQAGTVRRRTDRVRAALGRGALAGARVREVVGPEEVTAAVAEHLDAGLLAVLGGDGTLQATLTALERAELEVWPELFVAPAGRTNMSVGDLSPVRSLHRALQALERWASGDDQALRRVLRPAVRVAAPGAQVRAGMFFGAGAVSAGVAFFRERLYEKGTGSTGTSSLAVAWTLWQMACGRGEEMGLFPPMRWRVDGRVHHFPATAACLVSTLGRLILGTRPFWGEGEGPLRFTFVEHGARGFWRNIPRFAVGRPGRRLTEENGYFSYRAGRVELAFSGPWVLDGEIYTADADGALVLTPTRNITWRVA